MSKRALIVGINDFATVSGLRGCINDTYEMRGVLGDYAGFQDDDIRLLHDKDASSEGIRNGLAWLLSDYAGGGQDVRVFHFSSHGTQVADQSDDEWECQDEVIVPYDHDWDEPFRDDDLRDVFSGIPEDVSFTFIADCCHSGTIQRRLIDAQVDFLARYVPPPDEVLMEIETKVATRDAEGDAWAAAQLAQMLKDVPPELWAEKMQEYLALLRRRFRENKYAILPAGKDILLAGCEDRQTSADAYIDGEYRGAFTWGLAKSMKEANGVLTYDQLITRTGANLKQYDQRPQLECPPELFEMQVFAPLGP